MLLVVVGSVGVLASGPEVAVVRRGELRVELGQGLTYAPGGALLAAATTSRPETPGGERN